ncbi:ankyrin repeat-containing protein ITN1-like isoform X4 [Ipomoea triloba]|uniref:ankyrin repeat-containing protein ITN1-like isoform X4 n=1 Tax=Ipomoea triloba TaxID=35885 RepID=UPI00125DA7EC|nr:ankyrin repeat-containing protein ITN1-like isoform X4 [Ipomoea triloba]
MAAASSQEELHQQLPGGVGTSQEALPQQAPVAVDYSKYRPLYRAILAANWEDALIFFNQDPAAIQSPLNCGLGTALHVAAKVGNASFMEKLVALLLLGDINEEVVEALSPRNRIGNTPLHIAAWHGNIEVADILVRRNSNLLYLHNNYDWFPIHSAAMNSRKSKDAFLYFLSHTRDDEYGQPNPYAGPTGVSILVNLIHHKFYDLALLLARRYPDLGRHNRLGNDASALDVIVFNDCSIINKHSLNFLQSLIYYCVSKAESTTSAPIFHLITSLLQSLQMQRELQWFKEVKKIVPPDYSSYLNKDGKTPSMVFTEEHKELKEAGEKWMKDTANSCTIAAALIVTVVFAAAITVPGGNSGENGLPIFSNHNAFTIFAFSNAASLFTSTTSLLVFLSILTSRFAEQDFLYALPKRLIIGLLTLFLSIIFMMIAFSSTVYLVFGNNRRGVLIMVAGFACLPVTSFVLLQFPLLVALVSSTYGRGIFNSRGFPQLPY